MDMRSGAILDGRGIRWAGAALTLALLAGCASGPGAHPQDPFEPYNRAMTQFNDGVDRVVLTPVATVYRDVLPWPVRAGIGNFFANLGDAWSAVNNALQLRGQAAVESAFRFGVNTFIGIGGLFDVATEARIPQRKQDFGQTLAHWGVPTGPYLVLPLLGPSTVRDTVALPVDTWGDLAWHADPVSLRNSLYALRFVDRRNRLLGATAVRDAAALDAYAFTRDVYLGLRGAPADGAGGDDDGKLPEDY